MDRSTIEMTVVTPEGVVCTTATGKITPEEVATLMRNHDVSSGDILVEVATMLLDPGYQWYHRDVNFADLTMESYVISYSPAWDGFVFTLGVTPLL